MGELPDSGGYTNLEMENRINSWVGRFIGEYANFASIPNSITSYKHSAGSTT